MPSITINYARLKGPVELHFPVAGVGGAASLVAYYNVGQKQDDSYQDIPHASRQPIHITTAGHVSRAEVAFDPKKSGGELLRELYAKIAEQEGLDVKSDSMIPALPKAEAK